MTSLCLVSRGKIMLLKCHRCVCWGGGGGGRLLKFGKSPKRAECQYGLPSLNIPSTHCWLWNSVSNTPG